MCPSGYEIKTSIPYFGPYHPCQFNKDKSTCDSDTTLICSWDETYEMCLNGVEPFSGPYHPCHDKINAAQCDGSDEGCVWNDQYYKCLSTSYSSGSGTTGMTGATGMEQTDECLFNCISVDDLTFDECAQANDKDSCLNVSTSCVYEHAAYYTQKAEDDPPKDGNFTVKKGERVPLAALKLILQSGMELSELVSSGYVYSPCAPDLVDKEDSGETGMSGASGMTGVEDEPHTHAPTQPQTTTPVPCVEKCTMVASAPVCLAKNDMNQHTCELKTNEADCNSLGMQDGPRWVTLCEWRTDDVCKDLEQEQCVRLGGSITQGQTTVTFNKVCEYEGCPSEVTTELPTQPPTITTTPVPNECNYTLKLSGSPSGNLNEQECKDYASAANKEDATVSYISTNSWNNDISGCIRHPTNGRVFFNTHQNNYSCGKNGYYCVECA